MMFSVSMLKFEIELPPHPQKKDGGEGGQIAIIHALLPAIDFYLLASMSTFKINNNAFWLSFFYWKD